MLKKHFGISLFLLSLSLVFVAGCATTKARQADPSTDLSAQVTQLQGELSAKDQQIQELQYQLQSVQSSLQTTSSSSGSGKATKSSYIRVHGVSVEDVQRALVNAGLDPGPVDGKIGKKTKSAIKDFQRRNNLSADGVVGERTWSFLKA